MKILFAENAWEDYLYWQQSDKKILKRINLLIGDIQREPFKGIGKPEPFIKGFSAALCSHQTTGDKLAVSNHFSSSLQAIPIHNPDKPEPKRAWLVREIPNSKFQIPNNGVSFGLIFNAFGDEYTAAFLNFKKLGKNFLSVNAQY